MAKCILVTFNGKSEIIFLDKLHGITKDPNGVQALLQSGNGLSRKCDQSFEVLVLALRDAGILFPTAGTIG